MVQLLSGRKIILGISGGASSYRAAELTRNLLRAGATVRCVMAEASLAYLTPLTLQALSGNEVITESSGIDESAIIKLSQWADCILIAPADADVVLDLAAGEGKSFLGALCNTAPAHIVLSPCFEETQWHDSALRSAVSILATRGFLINGSAQLAEGSAADTTLNANELVALIASAFGAQRLKGAHVLITAGPTREAIDPVRYISNHSSGKMGFALAQSAADEGAIVTLIAGPVALPTPKGVTRIDVDSAQQMYEVTLANAKANDIFISAAAVADYRPVEVAAQKIKKQNESLTITLQRNPDIIAAVAQLDRKPFIVGFAAETQHTVRFAQEKLVRKRLDMIVANDVSQPGIGFNSDQNAVTVLLSNGEQIEISQRSKSLLAQELIGLIASRWR